MVPEPESDEDDSDGEFELHPLLTASHRSTSNTPNSSAPSSPAPQSSEEYKGSYYNTAGMAEIHSTYNHVNEANSNHDGYYWTGHDYNSYYGRFYLHFILKDILHKVTKLLGHLSTYVIFMSTSSFFPSEPVLFELS